MTTIREAMALMDDYNEGYVSGMLYALEGMKEAILDTSFSAISSRNVLIERYTNQIRLFRGFLEEIEETLDMEANQKGEKS